MSDKASDAETDGKPSEPGTDTPQFDPFSLGLDELKTKIESAVYAEEPEPEVPVDGPQEPSNGETVAPEPEGDPATKPTEETETPTEADELRAMLELAESRAKHFESLIGSRTGEEGFFKQKAQKLESEIRDLRQRIEHGADDPANQPETRTHAPRSADPATTYLLSLAIKEAGQNFFAGTPGALVKDEAGRNVLDPAFQSELGNFQDLVAPILEANDPLYAATEVGRLLNAAWSKVERVKKEHHLAEIQRRRAEQGKRLKDKKRASAAASTGAPPSRSAKRAIDPFKLPIDELKKLAERESEGL
jgi:hypothetical protein